MKTTSDRIKEGMAIRNMKQTDLVERTGISKGALSSYISGRYSPKQNNIYLIAKALNVSEGWLMGFNVSMERKADTEKFGQYLDDFNKTHKQYTLSDEEIDIIDSMRSLKTKQKTESFNDSDEKSIINKINSNLVQFNRKGLNQVNSYTNDLLKIADYRRDSLNEAEIISFKNSISESSNKKKKHLYTYMQKIACAGTGFYFDDIPTDLIEAPYVPNADFIIGVNGDSMEPTFYDGDMVYVEKRQMVEIGDIGIFIVGNECYIKEAGKDGLLSHNANYDIILGNESIQCIGKVLGKVTNEAPARVKELSPEDERARNIGRILSSQKSSKQKRN